MNERQAQLEAELAAMARQLDALPLTNSNRQQRLKLNDLKRQKETELEAERRTASIDALTKKISELTEALRSATPDQRPALFKAHAIATADLEALQKM